MLIKVEFKVGNNYSDDVSDKGNNSDIGTDDSSCDDSSDDDDGGKYC